MTCCGPYSESYVALYIKYYSQGKINGVMVVVNGVHLASCRVAGSNLGCGNF